MNVPLIIKAGWRMSYDIRKYLLLYKIKRLTEAATVGKSILAAACLGSGLLLIAGCRSLPAPVDDERQVKASVSREILLPHDDNVYAREDGAFYSLPIESEGNANPIYPATESGAEDGVAVNVKLLVDSSGHVYEVRSLDVNRVDAEPFLASVISTCMKWTFSPLLAHKEKVIPDGTVFGMPKVRVVSSTDSLPFSRDYRFFFSRDRTVEVGRDE